MDNTTSEMFEMYQGVHQECGLYPLLFNAYSEELFEEALRRKKKSRTSHMFNDVRNVNEIK